MTTIAAAGAIRRCGYSQCGNPLEYDGKGRPPEYCPDRRWPGGKTCKQMAAAERDGIRAAGLEAPLDEYAAITDRLVAAAGPLAAQLSTLLDTVAAVRDGALARVGEAERRMAEAHVRAEEAERRVAMAHTEQMHATMLAERARDQARHAEQTLTEVRQQADAGVAEATARLAAAEREHGAARAREQAAAAMRDEATYQARAAAEEAARIRDLLAATQIELEISKAEAVRAGHHARATDAELKGLHREVETLQARVDDLTQQRKEDSARAAALEHTITTLRAENAALGERLSEARETAAAATARADSAENRLTQVLALISPPDPAPRGAAPKGQPA